MEIDRSWLFAGALSCIITDLVDVIWPPQVDHGWLQNATILFWIGMSIKKGKQDGN